MEFWSLYFIEDFSFPFFHAVQNKTKKMHQEQEGHDGPGLLTWAMIGHESDGFRRIRDVN